MFVGHTYMFIKLIRRPSRFVLYGMLKIKGQVKCYPHILASAMITYSLKFSQYHIKHRRTPSSHWKRGLNINTVIGPRNCHYQDTAWLQLRSPLTVFIDHTSRDLILESRVSSCESWDSVCSWCCSLGMSFRRFVCIQCCHYACCNMMTLVSRVWCLLLDAWQMITSQQKNNMVLRNARLCLGVFVYMTTVSWRSGNWVSLTMASRNCLCRSSGCCRLSS